MSRDLLELLHSWISWRSTRVGVRRVFCAWRPALRSNLFGSRVLHLLSQQSGHAFCHAEAGGEQDGLMPAVVGGTWRACIALVREATILLVATLESS